jgi:hypothetical protein
MDYVYTNARSIIRGWKEKFKDNLNAFWARKVYNATGEYPDGIESLGNDVGGVNDEIERIEESIKSKQQIIF